MKDLSYYDLLVYKKSIVTAGRIILADELISPEIRMQIAELETIDKQEVIVLDDKELAVHLESFLESITQLEKDILFVFPGNGANFPRKLLSVHKGFSCTDVFAKRFWQPGSEPRVHVGRIMPELFMIMGIRTVVVVDDVISSGQTFYKTFINNEWRFPLAKWIGAAWVMQYPQIRNRSGVAGYSNLYTSCVVGKPNGQRVPINSISTLRSQPEIAKNYAVRYFREPERFLRLLVP